MREQQQQVSRGKPACTFLQSAALLHTTNEGLVDGVPCWGHARQFLPSAMLDVAGISLHDIECRVIFKCVFTTAPVTRPVHYENNSFTLLTTFGAVSSLNMIVLVHKRCHTSPKSI